jgi:hypothetical protein
MRTYININLFAITSLSAILSYGYKYCNVNYLYDNNYGINIESNTSLKHATNPPTVKQVCTTDLFNRNDRIVECRSGTTIDKNGEIQQNIILIKHDGTKHSIIMPTEMFNSTQPHIHPLTTWRRRVKAIEGLTIDQFTETMKTKYPNSLTIASEDQILRYCETGEFVDEPVLRCEVIQRPIRSDGVLEQFVSHHGVLLTTSDEYSYNVVIEFGPAAPTNVLVYYFPKSQVPPDGWTWREYFMARSKVQAVDGLTVERIVKNVEEGEYHTILNNCQDYAVRVLEFCEMS